MDDDINTPKALSVVFELITKVNQIIAEEGLSSTDTKELLSFWNKINKVLGLELIEKKKEQIPAEIIDLANQRKKAREEKDFEKADKLRDKILQQGFVVEDESAGFVVMKK